MYTHVQPSGESFNELCGPLVVEAGQPCSRSQDMQQFAQLGVVITDFDNRHQNSL
jgi:hypothetical protein